MHPFKKIEDTFLRWKAQRFWRKCDYSFVAIHVGDDRVFGKVKNNLGLLEGIPLPETGYFYQDIVKVTGPVGTLTLKDEEVPVFTATGVYKEAHIKTIVFHAILPDTKDYFKLIEAFKERHLPVRFPWHPAGNPSKWEQGYCCAESLELANAILNQFVREGAGRKVKDVSILKNEN